jgi:hypothetical protein
MAAHEKRVWRGCMLQVERWRLMDADGVAMHNRGLMEHRIRKARLGDFVTTQQGSIAPTAQGQSERARTTCRSGGAEAI